MTTNGTPCISGGYTNMMTEENGDLIRRSDALGCFHDWIDKYGDIHTPDEMAEYRAIEELPSVEQEKRTEERTETHACDCISRADVEQTVEDNILCYTHSDRLIDQDPDTECHMAIRTALRMLRKDLRKLPSAQPERTCVNCGRTANNGGWYADGRTRCPIEEHYALPKDGYCHLWEKRNVTDDDYPERRTDE